MHVHVGVAFSKSESDYKHAIYHIASEFTLRFNKETDFIGPTHVAVNAHIRKSIITIQFIEQV